MRRVNGGTGEALTMGQDTSMSLEKSERSNGLRESEKKKFPNHYYAHY